MSLDRRGSIRARFRTRRPFCVCMCDVVQRWAASHQHLTAWSLLLFTRMTTVQNCCIQRRRHPPPCRPAVDRIHSHSVPFRSLTQSILFYRSALNPDHNCNNSYKKAQLTQGLHATAVRVRRPIGKLSRIYPTVEQNIVSLCCIQPEICLFRLSI